MRRRSARASAALLVSSIFLTWIRSPPQREQVLDACGLLRAAVGFAGCSMPSYARVLWALRTWLDSWTGIGRITVVLQGHRSSPHAVRQTGTPTGVRPTLGE